ncbi:hypothetical protein BpHYR1_013998 [Brachionus plicatilis]|uniref:Uncharacterized protein n=1 Tax=Brachionus plicatilis TaxID=10195 RepID=A0A3M7SSH8_BRAPC|nr:hypothetical protein BpHYR1_013998 [Brachionus plicatilis]
MANFSLGCAGRRFVLGMPLGYFGRSSGLGNVPASGQNCFKWPGFRHITHKYPGGIGLSAALIIC